MITRIASALMACSRAESGPGAGRGSRCLSPACSSARRSRRPPRSGRGARAGPASPPLPRVRTHAPSSVTATTSSSSVRVRVTRASSAPACLTTLVRASLTKKYAAVSTRSPNRAVRSIGSHVITTRTGRRADRPSIASTRPWSASSVGWMPWASRRSWSSASRTPSCRSPRVVSTPSTAGVPRSGQSDLRRQPDQLLLGAVMEVALDPPPRRLLCLDQPATGRGELGGLPALLGQADAQVGGEPDVVDAAATCRASACRAASSEPSRRPARIRGPQVISPNRRPACTSSALIDGWPAASGSPPRREPDRRPTPGSSARPSPRSWRPRSSRAISPRSTCSSRACSSQVIRASPSSWSPYTHRSALRVKRRRTGSKSAAARIVTATTAGRPSVDTARPRDAATAAYAPAITSQSAANTTERRAARSTSNRSGRTSPTTTEIGSTTKVVITTASTAPGGTRSRLARAAVAGTRPTSRTPYTGHRICRRCGAASRR